MSAWLALGDAPLRFVIDQDLELQAADKTKATIRYTRFPLEAREIRQHLTAGMSATRLGLTWNDRISFVLTDKLQVETCRVPRARQGSGAAGVGTGAGAGCAGVDRLPAHDRRAASVARGSRSGARRAAGTSSRVRLATCGDSGSPAQRRIASERPARAAASSSARSVVRELVALHLRTHDRAGGLVAITQRRDALIEHDGFGRGGVADAAPYRCRILPRTSCRCSAWLARCVATRALCRILTARGLQAVFSGLNAGTTAADNAWVIRSNASVSGAGGVAGRAGRRSKRAACRAESPRPDWSSTDRTCAWLRLRGSALRRAGRGGPARERAVRATRHRCPERGAKARLDRVPDRSPGSPRRCGRAAMQDRGDSVDQFARAIAASAVFASLLSELLQGARRRARRRCPRACGPMLTAESRLRRR